MRFKAEVLVRLLSERRMTQQALAELIGKTTNGHVLTQSMVSRWSIGKQQPDNQYVTIIATFFGVKESDLWDADSPLPESGKLRFLVPQHPASFPLYHLLSSREWVSYYTDVSNSFSRVTDQHAVDCILRDNADVACAFMECDYDGGNVPPIISIANTRYPLRILVCRDCVGELVNLNLHYVEGGEYRIGVFELNNLNTSIIKSLIQDDDKRLTKLIRQRWFHSYVVLKESSQLRDVEIVLAPEPLATIVCAVAGDLGTEFVDLLSMEDNTSEEQMLRMFVLHQRITPEHPFEYWVYMHRKLGLLAAKELVQRLHLLDRTRDSWCALMVESDKFLQEMIDSVYTGTPLLKGWHPNEEVRRRAARACIRDLRALKYEFRLNMSILGLR